MHRAKRGEPRVSASGAGRRPKGAATRLRTPGVASPPRWRSFIPQKWGWISRAAAPARPQFPLISVEQPIPTLDMDALPATPSSDFLIGNGKPLPALINALQANVGSSWASAFCRLSRRSGLAAFDRDNGIADEGLRPRRGSCRPIHAIPQQELESPLTPKPVVGTSLSMRAEAPTSRSHMGLMELPR